MVVAASALEPLPLRLLRAPLTAWAAAHPNTTLGGLHYGASADGGAADDAQAALLSVVGAQRLQPSNPIADAWCSAGPIAEGRSGVVRWRHDGCWLHGAIDVPVPAGDGLGAVSQQAYREVFATLRETGLVHLQRVWNYLPDINAESAGMERYRQFNSGRQQAFIDDGRDVLSGSPAACALGTHDGHLRIRFLAGRTAALPVENPRQVPAYRYPSDYGPRRPSFSRAALIDAGAGQVALLISGTASIVDHQSVHRGDVQAQARETLVNLQAVIDAAHARSSARFRLGALACTVYVRHTGDADAVLAVLAGAVGQDHAAQAVVLAADICRSELLVEIEAHGFAPGRLQA